MNGKFLVTDVESFLRKDTKWKAPEDNPNLFAPIPCHGIAAIGGLLFEVSDKYNRCLSIGTFGKPGDESTEHSRLKAFLEFYRKENPVIVTFNGRGFDIPVIWHRMMHFGMQIPEFFEYDFTYRFSKKLHYDFSDVMSDYNASVRSKLDIICEVIGLPGKVDVDGSMVHGLFEKGEYAKIHSYVQCDVIQEAYTFLRYMHVREEISTVAYNNLVHSIRSKAQERKDDMISNLISKIDFSVLLVGEPRQQQMDLVSSEEKDDGIPF